MMKIAMSGRKGSIILVVSIIMTFLVSCMITSLLATSQLCALAHARCLHQQQQALLEGLLNVGLAYCCENREHLFGDKKARTMHLAFDPWPAKDLVDKVGNYQGFVVVRTEEKQVRVEAVLGNKTMSREGSCCVRLQDEKKAITNKAKLVVCDWRIS